MEQRKQLHDYDMDDSTVRDLSILLGVVATAFIAIGVMVYAFGDDQSSMRAANNPPAQSMPAAPSTVGQGGAP